jgi:hypothetical protein
MLSKLAKMSRKYTEIFLNDKKKWQVETVANFNTIKYRHQQCQAIVSNVILE